MYIKIGKGGINIKIIPILIIGFLFLSGFNVIALTEFNDEKYNIPFNKIFISNIEGPQEEWNKTFGTSNWDQSVGLEFSNDGGYVICGTKNALGYDNDGDFWIIRTDYNGDIEWENIYGGSNTDWCHDFCTISSGGYALVGATKSYGARNTDLLLIRTDEHGVEEWSKIIGGEGEDRGIAIQATSDSGFIISGVTSSFDNNEAWLIKTDQYGIELWNKTFGENDNDGEYLVTVLETLDGGYIAAGRNYLGDTSDTLLVKTDINGNVQWEKLIGESEKHDAATFINYASDGGFILTGQVLFPDTEHDIYLKKIDNDGNEEWIKFFGTNFFDTGMSVIELSDGCYLITGEVATNQGPPFIHDIILIKTDSDGNKIWEIVFGGSESDQGFEGYQTDDGGYIVAGLTESYGIGNKDAWLIKFSSFDNQRPNRPSVSYDQGYDELVVFTTDPDGDKVKYGVSWDNDGDVDQWTTFYDSGVETRINCGGRKGPVGVIAEDEYEAQSDWTSVNTRNKPFTDRPFPRFLQNILENHQIMYQLFQLVFRL